MESKINKTIIITGAGGFIGRHLIKSCIAMFSDYKILGIGRQEITDLETDYQRIDLVHYESLRLILQEYQPEYIFHFAGVLSATNWEILFKQNVQITINLCQAIESLKLQTRLIVPGSAAEYGYINIENLPILETNLVNPVSPYGVSKAWQSNIIQYYMNKGLDIVLARIFNVIGCGMSKNLSIGSFADQLFELTKQNKAGQIFVGNLLSKRDFLDIYDVCTALILLAQKGIRGQSYNICSGYSVSMEWILMEMIKQTGLSIEIISDARKFKPADISDIYGSNYKIKRQTGWNSCIPLDVSIKKLMEKQ